MEGWFNVGNTLGKKKAGGCAIKSGRGGYKYNCKTVREGTSEKVKQLRQSGKSYNEIAELCGLKSRQHAYEIYKRSIAKFY